jgi:hypothetical protein
LGVALAFGGITFGCIPPGLEAVDYQLGPIGGYALLVLAILCGIGAVVAFFWPWLRKAWSWIRRDSDFQRLNTELKEAKESQLEEIRQANQDRDCLEKELEEIRSRANGAGKGDSASTVAQIAAERDRLREELESRKADAGLKGKFAYDQTEKAKALEEDVQRLTAERDKLQSRGIPKHMVSDRHIRYHSTPIRLVDLLEVAGEDGVLRDFTFEHCILEGPGIISLGGPFPSPKTTDSGPSGSLSVGPTNCRVEGAPETVLYEIAPGGKTPVGVIHLAGYTLRDVTFRGLGFVVTPDELSRLRKQLNFSET